jgi:hypothetical protein
LILRDGVSSLENVTMTHSFASDFGHRFEQCLRAEIRAVPLAGCIDHSGVTTPRTLIGPVLRACYTALAYARRRHTPLPHGYVLRFAHVVEHSLHHRRW